MRALRDGHRRSPGLRRPTAPPEFIVVNLIAQHDVEAHQELSGEGDLRFGPPPPMHDAEVAASQIIVRAGGQGRGFAQHPVDEGVALLGDLAESLFSAEALTAGADVAHDMLDCRGSAGGAPRRVQW